MVQENFGLFHRACVNLAGRLLRELGEQLNAEWGTALHGAAAYMVQALPSIQPTTDPYAAANWQRLQKAKSVDAGMVAGLLEFLRSIGADALRMHAAKNLVAGVAVFDPGMVIVPALALLHERERKGFASDAAAGRLWVHAAEFLLARSERPPASPTDWRQAVTLSCKCEDCRGLQAFALDAQAQVARFKAAEHRRLHLEGQIRQHGLDMNCLTERKGSPRTLVCTKTRRTFQGRCEQHRADCASMNALLDLMCRVPDALAPLARRLAAAQELKPPA